MTQSVLVCGEALIDLVGDVTGGSAPAIPGEMAAGAGESWPVPFHAYPGGSPANTAVALARLGVPTALAARLSGDAFGRIIRTHLERNQVDLSYVVEAAEPTTLAVVALNRAGDATYSFYTRGTADWQWTAAELPDRLPGSVAVVHSGSLALALPPGGRAVERFLTRHRTGRAVSIDPNVRPDVVGDLAGYAADLERWVALADIVKASMHDITTVYPGEDPIEVARRWHRTVPLVVVTAGERGATALFNGQIIRVPAPRIKVADTVAAGDSFSAGLLDGLLRAGLAAGVRALSPAAVRFAVERGCAVSAITCSRVGADPPQAADVPGGPPHPAIQA